MKLLHFVSGKKHEIEVLKETDKYLYIRLVDGFHTKYRIKKENMEVQDYTYHDHIKGLFITEE